MHELNWEDSLAHIETLREWIKRKEEGLKQRNEWLVDGNERKEIIKKRKFILYLLL